jgi:YidC/Oxa1 family membrane protein insertase
MRLQQEMMQLYKVNGVNPLAGCLPVLAMMPVYIALYKTIYSSVELYHAPLGLWIHDLSERDPTYILPVLLGVVFLI